MKKIIFRADDLGYSEGVNLGIAKTVKKGLVRTVGLIVNLEHSKEGCIHAFHPKIQPFFFNNEIIIGRQ